MKRMISVLLAALILLSCAAVPATASAKKDQLEEIYDLYVFVPENKSKTLCLTWYKSEETKPDGYQIFRSDSGKKGTYEKIATTTEPTYTDSGLKNQTVYFYAVRAYAKRGGKILYSPIAKRDCCTKLTRSYAAKLLKKGYEIYRKWITRDELELNYNKAVTYKETIVGDDGQKFWLLTPYYLVKDKTFTTKKAIKKYLNKHFAYWCVGSFVDDYYVERNGRLYTREPAFVDGVGQIYDKFTIRDIAQKDDFASFSVLETWTTYTGDFPVMGAYTLFREKNRWVFSDNSWFPTKDWIERKFVS